MENFNQNQTIYFEEWINPFQSFKYFPCKIPQHPENISIVQILINNSVAAYLFSFSVYLLF